MIAPQIAAAELKSRGVEWIAFSRRVRSMASVTADSYEVLAVLAHQLRNGDSLVEASRHRHNSLRQIEFETKALCDRFSILTLLKFDFFSDQSVYEVDGHSELPMFGAQNA
jgi:hypothetical protein